MCHYKGAFCTRATTPLLPIKRKDCVAGDKVNYNQPVEWTGTCHKEENKNQAEKSHVSLLEFPPSWFCGKAVGIEPKEIRYHEMCQSCKAARREKLLVRRQHKKRDADKSRKKKAEEIKLKEDETEGKSREGSMRELKSEMTFGVTAAKSLMLLAFVKRLRIRQEAKGRNTSGMRRTET